MTGVEVYRAVLAQLKHENTTSMTPAEFRHHIAVAELEYLSMRYWAFDQHQKQLDDLRFLHVETSGIGSSPAPIANTGQTVPGKDVFLLPQDYAHLLNVEGKVLYKGEPCFVDGVESDWIACKYVDDSQEKVIRHHYYQKPKPYYPRMRYKMRSDNGVAYIQLLAGTSIPFKINITYLRKPKFIAVADNGTNLQDSEFDDKQTYEIVRWCVHSYLETIESYRLQTMQLIMQQTFQQHPPVGRVE